MAREIGKYLLTRALAIGGLIAAGCGDGVDCPHQPRPLKDAECIREQLGQQYCIDEHVIQCNGLTWVDQKVSCYGQR